MSDFILKGKRKTDSLDFYTVVYQTRVLFFSVLYCRKHLASALFSLGGERLAVISDPS